MNSDRVIFILIGLATLGILGFILSSSLTNKSSSDLRSAQIIGDNLHTKGTSVDNAKAILVEFSDFECPACRGFAPIVSDLAANYGDDLAIVYRHFPLTNIHPFALPAARASEAAAIQGKFWEYHDELFLNQPEFSQDRLISYAKNIGLDVEKFERDMKSADVSKRVTEDAKLSSSLGLRGTPTFFLVVGDKVEKLTLNSYSDLEDKVIKAMGAN